MLKQRNNTERDFPPATTPKGNYSDSAVKANKLTFTSLSNYKKLTLYQKLKKILERIFVIAQHA
jgi:hypothetical protein